MTTLDSRIEVFQDKIIALNKAKGDASEAVEALVKPFLTALLTKLPIIVLSTNDRGEDFDDAGHGYTTVADHLTTGSADPERSDFHPLALESRWAKLDEGLHGEDADYPPCGSLPDMLEALVREVIVDHGLRPSFVFEGEDQEGLAFSEWLTRELEMDMNEVHAALRRLGDSDFGIYASRRGDDGQVEIRVGAA